MLKLAVQKNCLRYSARDRGPWRAQFGARVSHRLLFVMQTRRLQNHEEYDRRRSLTARICKLLFFAHFRFTNACSQSFCATMQTIAAAAKSASEAVADEPLPCQRYFAHTKRVAKGETRRTDCGATMAIFRCKTFLRNLSSTRPSARDALPHLHVQKLRVRKSELEQKKQARICGHRSPHRRLF